MRNLPYGNKNSAVASYVRNENKWSRGHLGMHYSSLHGLADNIKINCSTEICGILSSVTDNKQCQAKLDRLHNAQELPASLCFFFFTPFSPIDTFDVYW